MDPYQQSLFDSIQAEKRKEKPDRKLIAKLAKRLSATDDRTYDMKWGRRNDPGGRSRSPSLGVWVSDDERWYS